MENENELDETNKCYLEYVDGYLTCTYNHTLGADCLMNKKEDWIKENHAYTSDSTMTEMPKFNWFQKLLRFIFRVK